MGEMTVGVVVVGRVVEATCGRDDGRGRSSVSSSTSREATGGRDDGRPGREVRGGRDEVGVVVVV